MKYIVTDKPNSQIQIDFVVEASELKKELPEAARDLSKNVSIAGFRPGHVPLHILEQKLGRAEIWQHAAEHIIPRVYAEAVREKNLEPIGRPEVAVKKVAPDNDFEFSIEVYVLPQFELPNYKGLKAEKKSADVEEAEVEKVVETLRNMRSEFHNVERAAAKNDRVEVDLIVKREGKVIENGESKNMPLVLGEEKFIPGFEDQIIGMKKEDTKEFSLKFPEKYHNKDLAGKEAQFTVTVRLVQEVKKPEIDETFLKTLGPTYKDVADFKQQIRTNLEIEKKEKEKERYQLALFEKIEKEAKIEVPKVLLDAETEKMFAELTHDLTQQGMELPQYLQSIKKTEEELKEGFKAQAERRVKAGLILRKIAELEKVEIPEAEIDHEVQHAIDMHSSPEEKDVYRSDRYRDYVREQLKNRHVFGIIEKNAKE